MSAQNPVLERALNWTRTGGPFPVNIEPVTTEAPRLPKTKTKADAQHPEQGARAGVRQSLMQKSAPVIGDQSEAAKMRQQGGQKVGKPTAETKPGKVMTAAELTAETARLLDSCREWVCSYVVLSHEQAVILAVWVLHTWAFRASVVTAYIHVTSAELGSGKTVLLLTLRALVREPRFTDNMSPAALARIVGTVQPTLLIDELDAVLQADKERAQDLRGILNGGYEQHGTYTRCVGKDFEVVSLPTFSPKILSGIGELWPTVASRAIRIELKRKLRSETVEPFRSKRVQAAAEPLRNDLAAWAESATGVLQNAPEPATVPGLNDRQADFTEPLLSIAALAGDEHLRNLVDALQTVLVGRSGEDVGQSLGTILLADIHTVFDSEGTDRIASAVLAERLCGIEGHPWAEWNRGRGMTANNLARQLAKYHIAPGTIRTAAGTPKGYKREDFEDTWNRLLAFPLEKTATPPQSNNDAGFSDFSTATTSGVLRFENAVSANNDAGCGVVALQNGGRAEKAILASPFVDENTFTKPTPHTTRRGRSVPSRWRPHPVSASRRRNALDRGAERTQAGTARTASPGWRTGCQLPTVSEMRQLCTLSGRQSRRL